MAGPIRLWRIAKVTRDYAADDLSGEGAALAGGRWNSKGLPVVYASSSIALACLETLAHLGAEIAARNRFLVEVSVPLAIWKRRQRLDPATLDPTWLAEPPCASSVRAGDTWIAGRASALLEVPSVIIHEERNLLINPAHPDARRISAQVVRQFMYDPRL